jgi:hypothetical protein
MIVARQQAEKSRLKVAPGCGALRLGTAIFLKLEKGKLPGLGSFPFVKLLAPEFA